MTDYNQQFEGLPDQTVLTTANSATGGSPFSAIFSNNVVASGALKIEALAASYGSFGCRITLAAGASYGRFEDTAATASRKVMQRTFTVQSTLPTTDFVIMRADAGGSNLVHLCLMNTGKIRIAPGGTTQAGGESGVLTAGKYLMQMAVTPGTATTGRVEYRILNPTTGAVIGTPYDSGATLTMGTGIQTRARFGGEITGKGWTYDDMDDCRWVVLASGWPTLLTSNSIPTADAGGNQTVPAGSLVTLPLDGDDVDGTIVSYNLVQSSGTSVGTIGGSGQTRTFTAPILMTNSTLTFGLTVTDDGGAVSPTDTVSITIQAAPIHMKVGGVIKPAIRRMTNPA